MRSEMNQNPELKSNELLRYKRTTYIYILIRYCFCHKKKKYDKYQ